VNKPWQRKQNGIWYVTIGGQQINLGRDKKEAHDQWHRMCAAEKRQSDKDPLFSEVLASYVLWAKKEVRNGSLSAKTLKDYVWYLDRFGVRFGEWPVSQFEPQHLTDWLAEQENWGNAGQRGLITALNRVLSWAKMERRIAENPIEGYKKPPQRRRDRLVQSDEHRSMILEVRNAPSASASDKQFQLVLIAIKHTGGRPQDVSRACVEFVSQDGKRWILPEHKRKKHTAKPKTVYLSPCLQTITKMVAGARESGPLFRGRRGELSVNAIGCRIKRIKKKLGISSDLIAYTYRHTYITDALQNGVDAATVAELVGTSIQMIERHYGHLCQRHDHMTDAAAKVQRRID
jgi:integrase